MGLRTFFVKLVFLAIVINIFYEFIFQSPLFFSLVIYLVWVLLFKIRYKKNFKEHKEKLKSNYLCSLVITFFMLHPAILESCFSAFS